MKITKDQYKQALASDGVLKDRSIELLTVLHDAPSCEATAPQLAEMLGHRHFIQTNGLIGNLGKRIATYLKIDLPQREDNSPGWWKVIAHGDQRPEGFAWRLRSELIDALLELKLLQDSDAKLYPEVVSPVGQLSEGKKKQVLVNAYERNTLARRLCIKHYEAKCAVCNFDFQGIYGEIGVGFIHVHHLLELSAIGKEYKVNPVTDLRPVCPNCHAMLHQRTPAFSIEELRRIIERGQRVAKGTTH